MSKSDHIHASVITPVGISHMFRRNPWVPVWWSVVLPGFGHIYQGQNLEGLFLMGWEILVNDQAHLNEAIYYTVLGQFDKAATTMDYRWAILYPLFYVFAMVDSYRIAVEQSEMSALEQVQPQRTFGFASISPLGVYALKTRSPIMSAIWSTLMPGMGHMYRSRILKALILNGWYLAIVLKSGISLAAYYTLTGQYDMITEPIDYQWLLFWPSIYIFGIVDAYSDTVELNAISEKAFQNRMRKYLKNEDLNKGAELPL